MYLVFMDVHVPWLYYRYKGVLLGFKNGTEQGRYSVVKAVCLLVKSQPEKDSHSKHQLLPLNSVFVPPLK